MIIFLNGTSSAGKTTLAKALQNIYPEPLFHIGIDHFFFSVAPRYVGEGLESHLGYQFIAQKDELGDKYIVSKGQLGKKMSHVLHQTVKMIADQNISLIIDDLLFSDDDFKEYLELLKGYKVYFIALKPPLHVVEEREKTRGDRTLGLSRGLYGLVYKNKIFDLEIDNSLASIDENTLAILNFIEKNPNPTAFEDCRNLLFTKKMQHDFV